MDPSWYFHARVGDLVRMETMAVCKEHEHTNEEDLRRGACTAKAARARR